MVIEIEKSDLFNDVFSRLGNTSLNTWISIYYATENGSDITTFPVRDRKQFISIVCQCVQSVIHPEFYSKEVVITPGRADRLYREIACLRSAQNIVMTSLFSNDDVDLKVAA